MIFTFHSDYQIKDILQDQIDALYVTAVSTIQSQYCVCATTKRIVINSDYFTK